jgi:hypothetical protein
MADDKNSRDKQASDREKRQRKREIEEERERAGEGEPEGRWTQGELEDALEDYDYPTTADELIDEYGEYEVETNEGWKTVNELLSSVGDSEYESAEEVQLKLRKLVG